jgi:hypothetical protein
MTVSEWSFGHGSGIHTDLASVRISAGAVDCKIVRVPGRREIKRGVSVHEGTATVGRD